MVGTYIDKVCKTVAPTAFAKVVGDALSQEQVGFTVEAGRHYTKGAVPGAITETGFGHQAVLDLEALRVFSKFVGEEKVTGGFRESAVRLLSSLPNLSTSCSTMCKARGRATHSDTKFGV